MKKPAVIIACLILLAALLAFWTLAEGRRQRRETAEVLASQAALLARALGPGLEAASSAAREIEENEASRVLESARLLAALDTAGGLTAERAGSLAEQNGFATVLRIDHRGLVTILAGEPVPQGMLSRAQQVLTGAADELLFGSDVEDGANHLSAVVRSSGGGAVAVRAHTPSLLSFSGTLGVENLLRRLAGSGGVLYLAYRDSPGGAALEASWDDGPVPTAVAGGGLRTIRAREVFEVEVPVIAPAGFQASLRVGLDGRPLVAASASALRRTTLVGIVLTVFGLALAALALLVRGRALERLEASRRLADAEEARRRHERLAAAGALTAGLAHEVRSPLNAIGLAAQRIERAQPAGEDIRRLAGKIRAEIGRLETILRQFLELARPVGEAREETDLHRLAGGVLELLGAEAEAAGVTLRIAGDGGRAPVDPESVRRSLINLVRNAVQASPPGGKVEVRVEALDGEVVIAITDQGPGLDAEIAGRAFDAFVTSQAGGTGLGLALVRRVAEEHRGSVTLRTLDGGGARAELRLPAASPMRSPR
jgi:signal transduction histidine kinase